jgi:hypothetical protein
METTASSGKALVRWEHGSGGSAYCLARLFLRPGRPVIVLTELAGNPDAVGLTTDFGGAATAAWATFSRQAELNPETIVWLAHHGDFSSYDATGAPETFTEVQVRFDGSRYHCEPVDHRLLPVAEAEAWRRALRLDPVPVVLAAESTDPPPEQPALSPY